MDKSSNLKKASSSFIWRLGERIGSQGVTLLVTIVLARLLEPTAFGEVAIMTVFVAFIQIFVDSGLSTALIRKKDADNLDFKAAFIYNITTGIGLYVIIFLSAPLISNYYQMQNLTPMLRVQSVIVIISALKNIQFAYVSRTMQFKLFFFSTLTGNIVSGVLGIVLAYSGFGTWSLVIQSVFNNAISALILWITVRWRPTGKFLFTRLFDLLKFSWKILVTVLIDTLLNSIRQLIIAKKYSAEDLAFYTKGSQYTVTISSAISVSLDSVLLPMMSQNQYDNVKLKQMTRLSMRVGLYCIMPLLMGFCFIATPVVRLLLTEKWLPAVPFIIIFCIDGMLKPIHAAHYNALNAKGRSDIVLKLGIVKTVLQVIFLVFTVKYGVIQIALGYIVCSFIGVILDSIPNIKILKYTIQEQLKDILPIVLINAVMGIVLVFINFLPIKDWLLIILDIAFGIIVYIVISVTLKIDCFNLTKNIIIDIIKKIKRET